MHPNPRRIIPIVLPLAIIGITVWYFVTRPAAAEEGALAASGTVETVTVTISPELAGRVTLVNAAEGQAVTAGEVLVQFDTSLLLAQQAQAEATLGAVRSAQAAAEAQAAAAVANLALLHAGPSAEQLAVAQTVVDRAQVALDTAEAALEALPEAAQDTPDGVALAGQVDVAEANLANAQAQYDLAAAGARPEQLEAAEAQVSAARAQLAAATAQAEAAQAAVDVIAVQIAKLSIAAPVDGVVLARAIEPGEVAVPGAALLVIGALDDLTITVYVPEDRYGALALGQTAQVSVDSYPDRVFPATISQIADRAEFTPRNVQTAEGRQSTVFAIKLSLANSDGALKPGMPADVVFEQ
jgi:multidrug resistance efflux pump